MIIILIVAVAVVVVVVIMIVAVVGVEVEVVEVEAVAVVGGVEVISSRNGKNNNSSTKNSSRAVKACFCRTLRSSWSCAGEHSAWASISHVNCGPETLALREVHVPLTAMACKSSRFDLAWCCKKAPSNYCVEIASIFNASRCLRLGLMLRNQQYVSMQIPRRNTYQCTTAESKIPSYVKNMITTQTLAPRPLVSNHCQSFFGAPRSPGLLC